MGLIDAVLRKLPLFRGKERIARVILARSIKRKRDFWIKGKFNCEYLIPNIVESIGFEIFINAIYEQETSAFIVASLPENGVFLDLGANIGAITIPIHVRRKDVKIVCVEAAPWIYKYLKQNLVRNGAQAVYTINSALFYTDNEIFNFYSPKDKFGKGSLSSVFTDDAVPVSTIRVDTLVKNLGLERVDMIKIDVEGYEGHVFRGATTLLGGINAPDIILEFVDWAERGAKGAAVGDAQKVLRDFGYRIFYFKKIGVMEEVKGILEEGFFMLFATKKWIK
jgi:FkbM family methyltransferase